jgi:nucleoside-diphosphate-sugar epimerase
LNLLVGATGFVGGHVVEYLFQQGEISKGVFRKGSHLKIMDTNGVQGIEADLLDHHSLHEAAEGVDVIYNMASPMPGEDTKLQKVNTEGLLNLLEVATEAKVKAFVHLSTLDVFGFKTRSIEPSTLLSPSNEYQRTKAEAERLLEEFSKRNAEPRITIVRAAKAIGPRDESFVIPVLAMAEKGKVTVPGGGQMSFTHPKDIGQAMYKAAIATLPSGSRFNIKSFEASPEELARGIVGAAEKQVEVSRQGILSDSPLPKYTKEQLKACLRLGEQANWSELGYAPQFDLKSTCEDIANWYKKSPWVTESA